MRSLPAEWMARICSGDVAAVMRLYSDDAILIPTFEVEPLTRQDQLVAYFNDFIGQKSNLCGAIETESVQTVGYAKIYSGLYSFSWDGGSTLARYTFVWQLGYGRFQNAIVTHHSSEAP